MLTRFAAVLLRDDAVRWIRPCDDTSESLSQLCPFSNLIGGLGQSNMCMPRYKRIAPVWALSFGALLPYLRWRVPAVGDPTPYRRRRCAIAVDQFPATQ